MFLLWTFLARIAIYVSCMSYPLKIKIGDRNYDIEYKVSFKRTSSARIKKDKVVIRLSRFVFGRAKDEMIEKFLKWAVKRLKKVEVTDFVNPEYENAKSITTHNKVYELKVIIENRSDSRAKLKNGFVIEIRLPEKLSKKQQSEKTKALSQKIIMEDQKAYLQEVISELNQMYFKEKINSARFKRTESRFGSLSVSRNVNISYRLLFAPREVFRYVCVHELAHLKQFNHSKRFWAVVEEACPDYKVHEKWLRKNGLNLG